MYRKKIFQIFQMRIPLSEDSFSEDSLSELAVQHRCFEYHTRFAKLVFQSSQTDFHLLIPKHHIHDPLVYTSLPFSTLTQVHISSYTQVQIIWVVLS